MNSKTLVRRSRSLADEVISTARRPAGRTRFQEAIAAAGPAAAVNVGAGRVKIDGWINTDVQWRAGQYLDLMSPWPVPPGVVTHIYADNVIEHFTLAAARTVLRNMLGALAPGGGVRLATPDVRRTVEAYLENGELCAAHLERHRRKGYPVGHPVDLVRVTFAQNKHYLGYCFDYESLSEEMTAAGFVDVQRRECGESDDPQFAGLESRVTWTEAATMLVIEGRKPKS
jgi:predicted SAM-dependent methyltransferase